MVRLLPSNPNDKGAACVLFQSHNGAIAAIPSPLALQRPATFQSHNGAIAASCHRYNDVLISEFQSHNGAIAALHLLDET